MKFTWWTTIEQNVAYFNGLLDLSAAIIPNCFTVKAQEENPDTGVMEYVRNEETL